MTERSRACLSMARRGVPWEDASEEAETLRICPFEQDRPRDPSWLTQAEVWDRAAQRAAAASARYARMRDGQFFGCTPSDGP
jgi:hypothetical protein